MNSQDPPKNTFVYYPTNLVQEEKSFSLKTHIHPDFQLMQTFLVISLSRSLPEFVQVTGISNPCNPKQWLFQP